MINQFSKGDLVIGKLGTNPWWPGKVANCPKTNKCFKEVDSKYHVFVQFFEINTQSWIEIGHILNYTSRKDMELYLGQAQVTSLNSKYLNHVPQAMVELYNNSWKTYHRLQLEKIKYSEKGSQETKHAMEKIFSTSQVNTNCKPYPCEICLKRKIDFKYLQLNKGLLIMNSGERKFYFNNLMIDSVVDNDKKCNNFCTWKYHSRCVNNENDLVCSCNKSVWFCSICDELILVNQLFVCDKHECMRPYHRSCLSWYFVTSPDMTQCPLHHCINCSLDYMVPREESCDSTLVSCVKCKIAFHNDIDCLPAKYMQITSDLIICCRHFVESNTLQTNVSAFCFTCCREINGAPMVSCEFCPITYHKNHECLSSSIELTQNDNSFICEGCRFPYIRRSSYIHLMLPQGIDLSKSVHEWKFGVPLNKETDPGTLFIIQDENGHQWTSSIVRTISVNLQSLHNLLGFGLRRSLDMQHAIRHMSKIVCGLSERMKMRQNYYRNAFVLQYSGLFPVTQNVYQFQNEYNQSEPVGKCACINSCTTNQCKNVAQNMECTLSTCGSVLQCRNRRLQKLQYPRFKLVLTKGKDPFLEMEEAVVKDVLVMELVGEVKRISSINVEVLNNDDNKLLSLSADCVLDCNEFCNLSRFVQHSEFFNLHPKRVLVSGRLRIGLFSSRRIIRGETLKMDFNELLSFKATNEKRTEFCFNLTAWSETTLPKSVPMGEVQVIDLCDESTDSREETPQLRETPPYNWPLCPVCLLETSFDVYKSRILIHCQKCFTLLHFHCACQSLGINQKSKTISNSKLLNYVCSLCLPMVL